MSRSDKTWSIKEEGYLNKDNIIFKDEKYIELYEKMKEVNDELKEKKMRTSEIVSGLMKIGDILDKVELSKVQYGYYSDIIWYAIDLITIEKETIK